MGALLQHPALVQDHEPVRPLHCRTARRTRANTKVVRSYGCPEEESKRARAEEIRESGLEVSDKWSVCLCQRCACACACMCNRVCCAFARLWVGVREREGGGAGRGSVGEKEGRREGGREGGSVCACFSACVRGRAIKCLKNYVCIDSASSITYQVGNLSTIPSHTLARRSAAGLAVAASSHMKVLRRWAMMATSRPLRGGGGEATTAF